MGFVLAGLTFIGGASTAGGSEWLSYQKAVKTAKPALVLYGSKYCGYCPPARKAFEAQAVLDVTKGRFVLAYVDIGTHAGETVAEKHHVDSTPTLQVLSADGTEVWRLTSPGTSAELVAALQKVIDGESYARQEALLQSGELGPEDTLTLATAYLDRGWEQKGLALLATIAGDPAKYNDDVRQRANFTRIGYAPRDEQLGLLEAHLKAYPSDIYALINYAHRLPDGELDPKRAAMRKVADGLPMQPDPDLKAVGFRMIVQYVAYKDPSQAAWALPFALQRVQSAPSDMDNLAELTALAVLAQQPGQIETARQLVAAHAPAKKIRAAIAAGRTLAATTAANSSHGEP